jgi:hypothetical protein
MNERIRELAEQAEMYADSIVTSRGDFYEAYTKKFAELIVEECRAVVTKVYRDTPLELCGPLLTADEKIAEHFYGVK